MDGRIQIIPITEKSTKEVDTQQFSAHQADVANDPKCPQRGEEGRAESTLVTELDPGVVGRGRVTTGGCSLILSRRKTKPSAHLSLHTQLSPLEGKTRKRPQNQNVNSSLHR